MQSRLASFLEAKANVISGFFISWMVWVLIVAPLYDYETSFFKGFTITCIFTVSSLIRSYVIRRWFNKQTLRKWNEQQSGREAG
jgi:membrane protein implicated in regulation of membrane protease activity